MQIAAYIRVSSKSQDHAMQRDAIVGRLGPAVAEHVAWYAETASAKTNDRAELRRLLADARAGKLRELYAFRLDRLCRTGVSDTFRVVSELRAAGVTLHTISDGVTIRPGSDDVVSETLVFALSLAARLERTAINDRIAAARTHMAAKGEPWGRPPRVTPAERETAKRMQGEGRSVREISAALGVPRSTIGRVLRA
jgi:DNA invertase Pin-like site-specific DNA recombinase